MKLGAIGGGMLVGARGIARGIAKTPQTIVKTAQHTNREIKDTFQDGDINFTQKLGRSSAKLIKGLGATAINVCHTLNANIAMGLAGGVAAYQAGTNDGTFEVSGDSFKATYNNTVASGDYSISDNGRPAAQIKFTPQQVSVGNQEWNLA